MFHSLVVPLDGSAFSEQALPLALRIARRANAELNLAIVPATPPLDANREQDYLESVSRQVASAWPSRITQSVLSNGDGSLEYRSSAANLAHVLAQHTPEAPCDLIVMTTRGCSGIHRPRPGSVARSLLRIAPHPLVAIHPSDDRSRIAAGAERGVRHIVVPLDGSESAERAVAFARHLGEPFQARYTLVRVMAPIARHAAAGPLGSSIRIDPASHSRKGVQHYLDVVASGLAQFDVEVATQVLDGSSPANSILEYVHTTLPT